MTAPVFTYGSAANPLASIDERCPGCGGALEAELARCETRTLLAEASMAAEKLAWWRSLCSVTCRGCGWIGSAFRPQEAMAA